MIYPDFGALLACLCFGFVLGAAFTAAGFGLDRSKNRKRKAPARAANTDKRKAVEVSNKTAFSIPQRTEK